MITYNTVLYRGGVRSSNGPPRPASGAPLSLSLSLAKSSSFHVIRCHPLPLSRHGNVGNGRHPPRGASRPETIVQKF